jgi:hypothetical protein
MGVCVYVAVQDDECKAQPEGTGEDEVRVRISG